MKKSHPQSQFITIRGVNYHYLEYPAAGQTLFLLHGLGSSTYSWEALAPLLQAAGYRVYALDLKGAGSGFQNFEPVRPTPSRH